MSSPLGWKLPDTGATVFIQSPFDAEHVDVDDIGEHAFYFSRWQAERAAALSDRAAMFAYVPTTNQLLLVVTGSPAWRSGHVAARCACPGTWEEAEQWLRMAHKLVQT